MGPAKFAIVGLCLLPGSAFSQDASPTPSPSVSSLMLCRESPNIPAGVCKNALPKCADLKTKTSEEVKKLLSLKIYGFWKGKDLDLSKTTLDKAEGADLPQGMCSVVGHTLRYSGQKDLEFDEGRNNIDGDPTSEKRVSTGGFNRYSGKSCGKRPMMRKGGGRQNGKKQLAIIFNGEDGGRWSAAMMGAMPWAIRAAYYYTVEGKEIESVSLNDQALAPLLEAGSTAQQEMMYLYSTLDPQTQAMCTDPNVDLVNQCLQGAIPMDSAAFQLCRIVEANKIMQGGGVANAVVAQVMATAKSIFDNNFKDLLAGGPIWEALEGACEKNTTSFLGLNRRKKMAKMASCFHDGDWMGVNQDWEVYDTQKKKVKKRKGQIRVGFRIDRDDPIVLRKMKHHDSDKRGQQKPWDRDGNFFKDEDGEYKRFGVQQRTRDDGGGLLQERREEKKDQADKSLRGHGRGVYYATIAHGFESAVEYIIRNRICRQKKLSSESVQCNSTTIPDKPAGVKW